MELHCHCIQLSVNACREFVIQAVQELYIMLFKVCLLFRGMQEVEQAVIQFCEVLLIYSKLYHLIVNPVASYIYG